MNYKSLELVSQYLNQNKIVFDDHDSIVSYFLDKGQISHLINSLYKVSSKRSRTKKKYLKRLGNDIMTIALNQARQTS